jgi:hypothetical protein
MLLPARLSQSLVNFRDLNSEKQKKKENRRESKDKDFTHSLSLSGDKTDSAIL